MRARTICVVLYPGCQNVDASGPFEIFAAANLHLQRAGRPPAYSLLLATSQGLAVRTESGLRIDADKTLSQVRGPIDTLIVPGGLAYLEAERDTVLLKELRRLASKSRRVVGICTGVFPLAALKDGPDRQVPTSRDLFLPRARLSSPPVLDLPEAQGRQHRSVLGEPG
jgi:transcriptional regulator GlxA family with amidase domain